MIARGLILSSKTKPLNWLFNSSFRRFSVELSSLDKEQNKELKVSLSKRGHPLYFDN